MSEEMKSDQDWKDQARLEKERLSKELDEGGGDRKGGGGQGGPLPPADFMSFLAGLATQVMIHLGDVPNPMSGKSDPDLELARYHIDIIGLLEEKTRGNLSSQEEAELKSLLSSLRLRYVEAASSRKPDADSTSGSSLVTPAT